MSSQRRAEYQSACALPGLRCAARIRNTSCRILESGTAGLLQLLSQRACTEIALDTQGTRNRQRLFQRWAVELAAIPQRLHSVALKRLPVEGDLFGHLLHGHIIATVGLEW